MMLFAAVLLAVASPAQAAVTNYNDVAAFNEAVAAAGLNGTSYQFSTGLIAAIDPDGLTAGPASFAGQNPGAGIGFIFKDSDGITGTFYTHGLFQNGDTVGGNRLVVTFDAPVRGFAFDSNTWNSDAEFNPYSWATSGDTAMTLTTGNGDVLDLFTAAYDGSDPAPSRFNGILSSTEFSSVTLSVEGMNFQVTGFTLAAIPEPSTYAFVLSGLSLVVVANRRRRRLF
jgi:hypothetical protein